MLQKGQERFDDFTQALARLREAIAIPADNVLRGDALIQRFEFTLELCWKVLKDRLAAEGVDVRTPNMVFKEAYHVGWLGDDDKVWVEMLKDRNLMSHTYKQELADEVVERIPRYYPLLLETYEKLKRLAP